MSGELFVLCSDGAVWLGVGEFNNGNSVYVGYAREECEVYLEYDTAGIIESYELKGRKCHW